MSVLSEKKLSYDTTTDGLKITIETTGYRPELVKLVFYDSSNQFMATVFPLFGDCQDEPHNYAFSIDPTSANTVNGLLGYHLAVLDTNRRTCPSLARRYRDYFSELNLNTHQDLTGIEVPGYRRPPIQAPRPWNDIIYACKTRLAMRIRTRAWWYDRCRFLPQFKSLEIGTSTSYLVRSELEALSKLLLYISYNHFGLDLRLAEEAFEMFSNGELKLQLPVDGSWACVPASAFYFFLGEFALLAIHEDVDSSTWLKLVRILVRTQRVLCRAFPAFDTLGKYESYSGCAYKQTCAYSCREKRHLKRVYDKSSLAEVEAMAAQNAIEFLSGEVQTHDDEILQWIPS